VNSPTSTPTATPTITPTPSPTPGLPAPVLFDIINESNSDDYNVGWSSVIWADWHKLEENRNNTNWGKAYEGSATSINRSNMEDGQYCYRVSAFNAATYSNKSIEKCTIVGNPLIYRNYLPMVVGE